MMIEERAELVDFLRNEGLDPCGHAADLIESQAAELSALRERVKELEECLTDIVNHAVAYPDSCVLDTDRAEALLSTGREEG